MASFTFSIKTSYLDKNHLAPIIVRYSHDYKSFPHNTGIKVDPDYIACVYDRDFDTWKLSSTRKLSPIEKQKLHEADEKIRAASARMTNTIKTLKSKSLSLHVDYVKQQYLNPVVAREDLASKSVTTWYQEYIALKEREMGAGINSYRSTFEHFKSYTQDRGPMQIIEVTRDFLEGFRNYLVGVDLSANTIHKQFKNLRFFLNWVVNEDEQGVICVPKAYRKFSVKARYGDPIGLTVNQFFQLYQLNLTEHPNLEKTRDLFVFGVSIGGPRHGDLTRIVDSLNSQGFDLQHNTITYFERKTGNAHYEIILNEFGKEILQKYNNTLPPVPVNQIMNRHLESIGALLKWNELKQIPEYDTYGKIIQVKNVALKQLFSSKFMRKTAATIDNMLGVPTKTSMKRTGHKTFAAYSRYVDVNRESMELANLQWDKLKALKTEQADAIMKVG